MMSEEEFEKVRTKPYKLRSPTDLGNNEDDEDDMDDDDLEDEDEETCSATSKTESDSSVNVGMHNYVAQNSPSSAVYVTPPVSQQGSLYVPIGIFVNT